MLRYLIVGGDLRSVELAKLLLLDQNSVSIIGFTKDMIPDGVISASLEDITKADIIIAPMVLSYDDKVINAPFSPSKIKIKDMLELIDHQVLFGGKVSDNVMNRIKMSGIKYVDMSKREEMAILNAIPTAEGAIQVAMEEMPITLHKSNCMVLGFGRIGKVLSRMLAGLGANVYVMARKEKDLAWIFASGYNGLHPGELNKQLAHMDVIINTVPSNILHRDLLIGLKNDVVIIDVSSKPYGVNADVAKSVGVEVKFLPGIPGRVAPKTCAKYQRDIIYNIIVGGEVL